MDELDKYFTKIVGVTFENRQEIIKNLTGREKIRVRRELDNKYDEYAVAVDVLLKDWTPIGYISQTNEDIHRVLDDGGEVEISIKDITGGGDKQFGINIQVEHKKLPRAKYIRPSYRGALMPEILTQPNIPKPLHGLAPRTILGQKWWDKTRKKVYQSTDFHCIACGVSKHRAKKHKWLEAHEYWEIDYAKGTAVIKSIQPLCHYCHNFIHSGRLLGIMNIEKDKYEIKSILEHGFGVLEQNKLQCFPGTLELAKQVGADTYGVTAYEMPECEVSWKDWKLLFNGKEYTSKFNDISEWQEFYKSNNKKEI